MTTMGSITKAVAAVTLAAGLSIAGVAGAGTASADEESYIAVLDANNLIFWGNNDGAFGINAVRGWGYKICNDWNAGVDRATMTDDIYSKTDARVSYDRARFLVDAAISQLC